MTSKYVRTYVSTCVHSRGISKVIKAWYVHISSNPSNGYLYTQKVRRYNDDKIKLEKFNDCKFQESIDKKDTDICDSLAFLCAYNFPAVCFNIGLFILRFYFVF